MTCHCPESPTPHRHTMEETPDVRQSVMRRGEVSMTLRATEGEWPHRVSDVAKALSGFDRLLKSIAASVEPGTRVVPVLTRVDILDADIRLTVRVDPAPPRKRKASR